MLVFRHLCEFNLSRLGINPLLFHNSLESRNVYSFPTFSIFWIYNYLLRSLGSEMFFLPITILQAVGFWYCTLSIWSIQARKSAFKCHVRFSWGIYPFMLCCIVCLGKQFSLSPTLNLKSPWWTQTLSTFILELSDFSPCNISAKPWERK